MLKCLGFFAIATMLACGGAHAEAQVEIAQPLPTVAASSPPPADPVAQVVIHEPLEIEGLRDPRRGALRQPTLVAAELVQLVQLLQATPVSAPDHPLILARIASEYVELRKAHKPGASQKAIETYERIVAEHPTYASMPDVLYYLALEYEIAGDLRSARKTLYELIKQYPASSFVAYAYFAFGEMFMAEIPNDPSRVTLAQSAYTETMKLASPLAALATCRLIHLAMLEHDTSRASSLQGRYGVTCGD